MNRVSTYLTNLKLILDKLEGMAMDFLSAVTPWLAPLVPAYITLDHCLTILKFPALVAWTTAASVEFLGLTSVYTAMQLIANGARKGWLWRILIACAAWLFYIILVVGVNSLLETGEDKVKLAKGALSLISVVAAIILAVRSQYKAWLVERKEESDERKAIRREKQTLLPPPPLKEIVREPKRLLKDDILAYLLEHPEDAAHPKKVAEQLELNEGTVKVTISRLRVGGQLNGTNHEDQAN